MGYSVFCKNIVLNLILIVQLVASVVLINIAIGNVNAQRAGLRLFENVKNEDAVYFNLDFQSNKEAILNDKMIEVNDKAFKKLCGVESASYINDYLFSLNDARYNAYGYDSYISNKMKLPVSRGIWLTEAETEKDVIPVVVSSETKELSLGKTVIMQGKDSMGNLTELKLKVVGVLKSPAFVPTFTGSRGYATPCTFLFSMYNEKFNETPAIIFEKGKLDGIAKIETNPESACIIKFSQNISQSALQKNIEILRNTGDVATFDKMYVSGQKEVKDKINDSLPLIICILALSLVGLVSLNVLNTATQVRNYAIFYICGGRWKNCFFISLCYTLVVTAISLVISLLIYYVANFMGKIYELGLCFLPNNYLATAAVYLLVIILSLITPYIMLKRTYPIQIIKETPV